MIALSRNKAVVGLAGGMLASFGMVALAPQAQALSATCSAWKQTDVRSGMDYHRARASCSYIGSGTKVRAKLVRDGAVDKVSDWFTATGTTYSTVYTTCYAGCHAEYELAAR